MAAYFDNKHNNLNINGKSTSNTDVVYFVNGELKSEYSNYFDKYEVSSEERNNQIVIEGETPYTQTQLEDVSKSAAKYNEARLRIATAKYDKLPKGIGISEMVGGGPSFYGAYSGAWGWYKTVAQATAGTASAAVSWNNDGANVIGNSSAPFIARGGNFTSSNGAGVFYEEITAGGSGLYYGFRPVLVP